MKDELIIYSINCNFIPIFPTGFLCISRKVFEVISKSRPDLNYTEIQRGTDLLERIEYFDYFPQGVKNGEWVGEDYSFCDLWTATGGKIYVYPNMTFSHYSSNDTYTGNFYNFLKGYTDEQATEANEKPEI